MQQIINTATLKHTWNSREVYTMTTSARRRDLVYRVQLVVTMVTKFDIDITHLLYEHVTELVANVKLVGESHVTQYPFWVEQKTVTAKTQMTSYSVSHQNKMIKHWVMIKH